MAKMYEYLADNTHSEPTQRLLKKFAEDERSNYEMVNTLYEAVTGTYFPPPALPQIVIPDFHTALLECIIHEITDIDNYKTLSAKLQVSELRCTLYKLLQCKVRHGYGLLVLIAPDDISLDPYNVAT
jgi:rubrerythrin